MSKYDNLVQKISTDLSYEYNNNLTSDKLGPFIA
jgi:hypothetical protein